VPDDDAGNIAFDLVIDQDCEDWISSVSFFHKKIGNGDNCFLLATGSTLGVVELWQLEKEDEGWGLKKMISLFDSDHWAVQCLSWASSPKVLLPNLTVKVTLSF